MKRLNELINCNEDLLIEAIEEDSRIKVNNYLFCCIKGLTVDGHDYVNNAIENGAVAIIASKDIDVTVPVIKVKDTNKTMLEVLSKFYDEPDKKLKMIGVTGTDGKTTLSSIIYQLINNFNNCGYIGTNGVECNKFYIPTKFTTPFPKELYYYLSEFHKAQCKYIAMEVSSERLLTNRLNDFSFDVAIFTNITRDHLDKHKTMENYIESKSKLFKLVKNDGYCIVNNDDKYVDSIKTTCTGKIITYGIKNQSDIMADDIIVNENSLRFKLRYCKSEYDVVSPLSGMFNVYNLMAAISACVSLGFDIDNIISSVKKLKPIGARSEFLNYGQSFKIMIDYAHTANALKNLLEYVNAIAKGKIITVTGSAGDRDSGKRSDMGEVVTKLSDYVIFTTDDPRTEDPNNIIDDLISTIKDNKSNYERVINRKVAIHKALSMAGKDDFVVIAGKGRDLYMAVGNGYIPYSDVTEITEFFMNKT